MSRYLHAVLRVNPLMKPGDSKVQVARRALSQPLAAPPQLLLRACSICMTAICWQRGGLVLDLVQDIRAINIKAMKARHTGGCAHTCLDL